MGKINRESFGYLGIDFQVRLITQILVDTRFGESIIGIIDANYFEDQHLRIIVSTIKETYEEYEILPDVSSLEFRLLDKITNEIDQKYALAQLKNIKEANQNDGLAVQDKGMKFCKQQELKKSIKEIQAIIDKGDLSRYDEMEDILKKALEHGDNKDNTIDVFDNIDEVLADDFRDPIATGIKGLDEIMGGGLSRGEFGLILAGYGTGKEQPNSARIYTPNGYKLMGEMKVGDAVVGSDGKKQSVTGVFPQGLKDIYKVSFNDGTSTHCGLEHLWAVNSMKQRNRSTKKNGKNVQLPKDNSFRVLPTHEIIEKLIVDNGRHLNYKIPIIKPVQFEEKNLEIHPYVMGVLLGDGFMGASRISTKDIEIVEILSSLCEISHRERCREIEGENNTLILRCLEDITVLKISGKLKKLGLFDTHSNDKFIPKDYIYNSIDNRIELLQGLMDTDGYCDKRGIMQYSSVSEQLMIDVKELVLSLGGSCRVKTKIPTYKSKGIKKLGQLSYILTISFPAELNIKPFKLERKLNRVRNRTTYAGNKYIKSIEFSHKEEATCIMVDNNDHLYVTDDFILTHNTTALTKIANTGKELGKNVLQIYFEDSTKVIQRKHLACWSGIELNDFKINKELLKELAVRKDKEPGVLRLKRFSSDGTTPQTLKKYIRKLIASGFRPDLVTIDYVDCLQPSKRVDDVNVGEGNIMRELDAMADELNIALWSATQGNRGSLNAEIVQANQMGGSIKKGQVAHFVMSIAKTLAQKESKKATIAILKSRFGDDGMILEDILFDNGRVQIDMSESTFTKTQGDYKKGKEIDETKHVANVLSILQKRKQALATQTKPTE